MAHVHLRSCRHIDKIISCDEVRCRTGLRPVTIDHLLRFTGGKEQDCAEWKLKI